MTNLTRRDPFGIPTIDRFISQIFDEPVVRLRAMTPAVEEGALALDVSEDENDVIVRASLPGFKKEDIDVEVHDGVLAIKAEQEEEKEEKGEQFYRRERRFGSVSRRIALPSQVVEDKAAAELKDGVLTLRLPKTTKATARKVAIR